MCSAYQHNAYLAFSLKGLEVGILRAESRAELLTTVRWTACKVADFLVALPGEKLLKVYGVAEPTPLPSCIQFFRLHLFSRVNHLMGLCCNPKRRSETVAGIEHSSMFLQPVTIGWHQTCAASVIA